MKVLERVGNPRRHRWNAYLRACRAIPPSSPVHGSTDFKRLNERRLRMIAAARRRRKTPLEKDPEFTALQRATAAWLRGPRVAQSFLLHRKLWRLERKERQ